MKPLESQGANACAACGVNHYPKLVKIISAQDGVVSTQNQIATAFEVLFALHSPLSSRSRLPMNLCQPCCAPW
jgi:hypothetical protein